MVLLTTIKTPLEKDCIFCLMDMHPTETDTDQLVACPKCGNLVHRHCWLRYVKFCINYNLQSNANELRSPNERTGEIPGRPTNEITGIISNRSVNNPPNRSTNDSPNRSINDLPNRLTNEIINTVTSEIIDDMTDNFISSGLTINSRLNEPNIDQHIISPNLTNRWSVAYLDPNTTVNIENQSPRQVLNSTVINSPRFENRYISNYPPNITSPRLINRSIRNNEYYINSIPNLTFPRLIHRSIQSEYYVNRSNYNTPRLETRTSLEYNNTISRAPQNNTTTNFSSRLLSSTYSTDNYITPILNTEYIISQSSNITGRENRYIIL
jgi:hypothetical protein